MLPGHHVTDSPPGQPRRDHGFLCPFSPYGLKDCHGLGRIRVFDELIPWQYSDQDRRVGYFFGKDRRGQLHRVPLMTLSVGVVTNQRRNFTRGIEVSELATEMKSYAKTLQGSVWAVDRRREEPAVIVGGAATVAVREQPIRRTAGDA